MEANISRTIIGCLLFIVMNLLHAESVYVKDTLRVGVRTEPNNSIAPIGVVLTGMQLDVLERRDDYIKIRTDKGLQGWIKETYVEAEPPAMLRLEQLQKEYDQLRARTGKHDEMIKSTAATNKTLGQQVDELNRTNAELKLKLKQEKNRNRDSVGSYFWSVLTYLGVFLLGIGGGLLWYRRHTMKRLGGLRV